MKFLNLDNQFQPFGTSIQFEQFTFNGGEPHIQIKDPISTNDEITMTTRIRQFDDVGLVLQIQIQKSQNQRNTLRLVNLRVQFQIVLERIHPSKPERLAEFISASSKLQAPY